jgi:hypothetical protein
VAVASPSLTRDRMTQIPQNFRDFSDVLIKQKIIRPTGVDLIEQPEDGTPIFVPKLLGTTYESLFCWHNCAEHLKHNRGRIVFGWALFYEEETYQAQHHAIWCSPEGDLLDITPDDFPSVTEIMFLPDGRVPYDYIYHRHPANCFYSPGFRPKWWIPGHNNADGLPAIQSVCYYVKREPKT